MATRRVRLLAAWNRLNEHKRKPKVLMLCCSRSLCLALFSCAFVAGQNSLGRAQANGEPSDIYQASRSGEVAEIERAVTSGVDPNVRDTTGITALCWAAAVGREDSMSALLRLGADVDATNEDGVTPLIAASFFGRATTLRILLENGADPNRQDGNGNGPLDVLGASWEDTQTMASALGIEIDRRQLESGRQEAETLLEGAGAEKTGNAIFVWTIIFSSVAGVAVLIALIFLMIVRHEKKRTEELRNLAPGIGLAFSAAAEPQFREKMQVFSLFNQGYSRKLKNVMQAETDDARLTVFDYQFTTGGGQSSRTHHHTVVSIESLGLQLPKFRLRPEGFLDRVGSAIGLQDIDFDDHQEFSDAYVLKGDDEKSIRRFFDAELMDSIASRKDIAVESESGFFIYRQGGRKKPEEIQQLMKDGYGLYSAFLKRAEREA
ncbi:MAG: ankyrin repeat domain-containing protein [Aureliella sp.]